MSVVPFDPLRHRPRRTTRIPAPAPYGPGGPPAAGLSARTPLPPAPSVPRLAVNLSPESASRLLAALGLGVALCATLGTTLALVTGGPAGLSGSPRVVVEFTHWLVSLPWLFTALVLFACSRVEHLVRPEHTAAWTTLSVVALAAAAFQVVGRDVVATFTLPVRAGLVLVLVAGISVVFRHFFDVSSAYVRARIAAGVVGGLLVGLGPFRMLGGMLLAAEEQTPTLAALLRGSDALLGLVLVTFAVHATLVYVRDYLPDFNIALETMSSGTEEERSTASR